ncbi:MAG: hypothetical protein EXS47_01725 [Candidatus Zambryskibacteria bacterium]|nr:hypothetical protein [Candidatus Zambryskibacteria bacterium]
MVPLEILIVILILIPYITNLILKRKKITLAICSTIFFILPNLSFAITGCSGDGYTISAINGIFTNKAKAEDNQKWLKYYVGDNYDGQHIDYQYLLNPTHLGGIGDIAMAAYQKMFDDGTVKDYDLVEMIKSASEKVTTQKLLLVAHSQGNFYANSFYDTVVGKEGGVPSESIGVYGVANPAGRVAGNGRWLTSDTDNVISGLISKFPLKKIMEPNVHIKQVEGNSSPLSGHDFTEVYLKYQGEKVVSDIKSSLDGLRTNKVQGGQEPCINPPKLSVVHKIEGVVFAVADPVANISRDVIGGTAGVVYKSGEIVMKTGAIVAGGVSTLGNVVGKTTFTATVWTYKVGVAVAKTTARVTVSVATSLYGTLQLLARDVTALVQGDSGNSSATVALSSGLNSKDPPLTFGEPPSSMVDKIARATTGAVNGLDGDSVVVVSVQEDSPGSVEEPGLSLSNNNNSIPHDIPKIIYIGLPTPGFGGGDAPKKLTSTGNIFPTTIPSQKASLSSPEVSVSQCDYSLALDGCLLATTTIHFEWSSVDGVDHYALYGGGVFSTTTDTFIDIVASDFSDYIFGVSAVSFDNNISTTTATTTKTVSVASIPIAINEIAWMGTVASVSDEWMELKNNTAHTIDLSEWALRAIDGTPYIKLTGIMEPREYRVLERRTNTINTDSVTEAYGNGSSHWALSNGGEEIVLSHASTTLDSTPLISNSIWMQGYNESAIKKSMERYLSTKVGSDVENWGTNQGFIKNGTDSEGNVIEGTPGTRNSVSYLINKGQAIDGNVTLTADDGYFIATSTVVTASGVLSIEAGTVIKFMQSEFGRSELKVFGELIVLGKMQNPVIFSPYSELQVGDIKFSGGTATSTIIGAQFENIRGVSVTAEARVNIMDSQFIEDYYGLNIDGRSTVIINNSLFASTTHEAISSYENSNVTIASSTISSSLNSDAIGVYEGTKLTISSTTIDRVYEGSAVGSYGSNVTIQNSIIKDVYESDGIAMYDSTFNISSSSISRTGGDGMGLYSSNSDLVNTVIENGESNGITISRGTATIKGGSVSGFVDGSGIDVSRPENSVAISGVEVYGNDVGIYSDSVTSISISPETSIHDNSRDIIAN